MLPKPALLSSIEVPEPALSLSSAGLALLRVLAVSMYFSGTIPDNGTTQPALYRPPHCRLLFLFVWSQRGTVCSDRGHRLSLSIDTIFNALTRYGWSHVLWTIKTWCS